MNDSEFECPHCGTMVYIEATRCPNCGLSFYPLDDEDEEDAHDIAGEGGASAWLGEAGAAIATILAGSLVSWAIAFGVHFTLSRLFSAQSITFTGKAVLFVSAPIGALAGGYVSGGIARQRPTLYGLAVGMLSIGNAILLETYWRAVTLQSLLEPGALLNWALILLAGLAGAKIAVDRHKQHILEELFFPAQSAEELYQDLYAKVGHDHEIVERLVEFERRKTPEATRTTLLKNAIRRWERDNR